MQVSETTFKHYSRHSGAVRSLVWSPNGTHIASASDDQSVHIWSVEGTDNTRQYLEHRNPSYDDGMVS